jgi:hypothetical protein
MGDVGVCISTVKTVLENVMVAKVGLSMMDRVFEAMRTLLGGS